MNDDVTGAAGGNRGTPVPPALTDRLEMIMGDLVDAQVDVDMSIAAVRDPVMADIFRAHSDVRQNVNEAIGVIDLDLDGPTADVDRAVNKASNSLFDEQLSAEGAMVGAGAFVPHMSDQMLFDMSDQTGESMVARLFGVSPEDQVSQTLEQMPTSTSEPKPERDAQPVPGDQGSPPLSPPPPFVSPGPYVPLPPPPPPFVPPPSTEEPGFGEPYIPPPYVPSPPPPANSGGSGSPGDGAAGGRPCIVEEEFYDPRRVITGPCTSEIPDGNGIVRMYDRSSQLCRDNMSIGASVTGCTYVGTRIEGESPPLAPPPAPHECSCDDKPLPPPPPPMVPVVGSIPVVQGPLFADPNICNILLNESQRYNRTFTASGPGSGSRNSSWSDILRVAQATAATMFDDVFGDGPADSKKAALAQNYLLTGDVLGGYSQAFGLYQMFGDTLVSQRDTLWSLGVVIGSAHKAESSSGMPLDYITTSLQYLYKSTAPQYIPDQSELDDLYLQKIITREQWYCWTRCHGNIPERREDVIASKRPTMTADEIVRLENRGGVVAGLAPEMWERAKFASEADKAPYRELAKFVPGASDLVRFMVRDSFDPEVVRTGQLDKDFSLKFYGPGGELNPGKAAAWAKAQGMTEDQFRYYWYSHWDYPSNTALYEMLHRLRPDRPEVQQWELQFGAASLVTAPGTVPPKPLTMTLEDVRKVIEINDVAPAMVDPLLAISYHPITRTDAIDAYLSGAFSTDDLYHVFRDNGYDEPTARTMVRIQEVKSARRNNNLTGVWSIRKVVRAYQEAVIDGQTADRLLTPLLPNAQVRQNVISDADLEVSANVQRAKIKKLRRGYIFGAYDDDAIIRELDAIGVKRFQAEPLLEVWREEKLGKYREPTARQIAGWLKTGIITTGDAVARLLLLGFAQWDVDRMVNQAVIEWAERQEAKVEKADKRAQKVSKSIKATRRMDEQRLRSELEAAEKEIEARRRDIDRVRAEMQDRGLPFDP